MPSIRLTKREIETYRRKATTEAKEHVLWDAQLKGFGIRIAPSGKASWFVKKYLGDGGRRAKQVKQVFADYAELQDPEKARAKAITVISNIRGNIDPSETKREKRKAQYSVLQSGKLKEAVDLYIKRNRKPGRYWDEVERKFNVEIIPKLGTGTLVAKITKQDIRSLIDAKQDKGLNGAARTLFALVRPFFKFCVDRDLITVSPIGTLEAPKTLKARDRVLGDDEIKALWSATSEMPVFGPFYRLLLLTAQRREEVAAVKRSELDLDAGLWTIPKERTKNGKGHVVHLSPQAIEIIKALPETCDLLFTHNDKTTISGYSKAKLELDEQMQPPNPWRVHDLRRTAASGMARLGFQPHIIERVLNHVSGATGGLVSVYQRYEYLEERKRAIEAWGNYVGSLPCDSGDATNNIFQLSRLTRR